MLLSRRGIYRVSITIEPLSNQKCCRDALTKIEALEDIILKIVKWKDDHPEAIQELIKVEKALAELIRPGPDGSLMSSQLGKMLTLVAASQLGRFWMYPAVFAAGAISMVGIYGLFKWILATNATASNGTSAITTPSVSAPQGQTSLPASLAPFEIPF